MRELEHLDLKAPATADEVIYSPRDLSRFVRFIHRRIEELTRWALGVIVGIVLLAVVVGGVAWLQDRAQRHRDCERANEGRAAIKQAFENLYDGFILARPGPDADAFKEQQMKPLEKNLPHRDC